ncbi:hypothetical protein H327_11345 [Vibrio parahaemolyticus 3324]|nr:hypothetical protein H321_11320 [Vibrio parahaemolyticus 97-10290]KIS90419.1 hypothetical protein H338_11290 [Vibrio parahaemolyticus EN9701173]KIS93200.1 hypothetical protein H333_11295 [Vibrio parahaemolyticus 12315]KIS98399.1 hypothetical protein H324_11290 [Vibrio parahaemolyticus 846]KIT01948.1 hypothetical protein H327_11345 [Vibrio parahaemolyticus 3324]KIT06826.1 hypothetical protein H339_11320 [Vibrio parahaemolyticus EN9901310]KIT21440.1 hypothetical protein H335_11285 [Vibrio pa
MLIFYKVKLVVMKRNIKSKLVTSPPLLQTKRVVDWVVKPSQKHKINFNKLFLNNKK